MLQINDKWITPHYKGKLYKARQTKLMEDHLKSKYNWINHTLKDIQWPSFKTVRQKLSHTKRMQTCKIVHGWLPINQCPGCKCTDETIDHFLQCPHPSLTEQRKAILMQMKMKGIKLRIPKDVLNAVMQTPSKHTGVGQCTVYNYQRIKTNLMARGFLTKQWLYTIHSRSKNPPHVLWYKTTMPDLDGIF